MMIYLSTFIAAPGLSSFNTGFSSRRHEVRIAEEPGSKMKKKQQQTNPAGTCRGNCSINRPLILQTQSIPPPPIVTAGEPGIQAISDSSDVPVFLKKQKKQKNRGRELVGTC